MPIENKTNSLNNLTWMWDFGDGHTSTENTPMHIFELPGRYTICANASNCYGTAAYCSAIEITVAATHQTIKNDRLLRYNVIKEQLFFTQKTIEKAIIYNEAGIALSQVKTAQNFMSVKQLPAGIYYLRVKLINHVHFKVERFVKL